MRTASCERFTIEIGDEVLDDLRKRLERTRWAPDYANADWRYGVESGYLHELVEYWLGEYDWREQERAINSFAHYRTTIDDVPIHFVHAPGVGPEPMPLIVTHGWPWSFWDLHDVIGPLSDPAAHGGDPADAFEVIVPSLPGFGFSSPLTRPGINYWRTADLFSQLMKETLGFERYGAQGGDFGAFVTSQLGHKYADELTGIHLTMAIPLSAFDAMPAVAPLPVERPMPSHVPMGIPGPDLYTDEDRHRLDWMVDADSMGGASSHVAVQTADPQTLAYAMNDSPVGLAAWLLQRRRDWSNNAGDLDEAFSKDDSINLVMLYWLTETAGTTFRYYWEAAHDRWRPEVDALPVVSAPTGVSLFAHEPFKPPNAWLREYYNLQRVTDLPRGGHFAPAEEPELWVNEIREFFRPLR